MKVYVKKNLVQTGAREITKPMRDLEGSIIDVVWVAGSQYTTPGWRQETTPFRYWDDDWLMILPNGYDLGKAVTVLLHWYDEYKQVSERWSKRAGDDALLKITLSDMEKKIVYLNNLADQLMDSIAQKDAVLLNIKDRITAHYDSHIMS